MYIVNTTFVMADTDVQAFTAAVGQFIPRLTALAEGAPTLSRVLIEAEPGQRSYALQIRTAALDSPAVEALAEFAESMAAGERILHFTTPMLVIS